MNRSTVVKVDASEAYALIRQVQAEEMELGDRACFWNDSQYWVGVSILRGLGLENIIWERAQNREDEGKLVKMP